ncbi:hypothetical protein SAMN05421734_104205 [Pelagirhabdus alkalitolerans]|uniref:CAAX prenyl protease 2/Lysostaphin resistance protein A-like domain-containing protein n=1 Tax=Pelagirhabdus alkalitolerans TaxID=1612202 RepID=A0A1G6J3D5_9BACI|nr:type II CAAX endopeptidase family protein [Pelagirhabdus alkalitolerans]SDC12825.1 hypothetical protein SAMN05421734_104205 [Pelagirhabdus alkalitolerans]
MTKRYLGVILVYALAQLSVFPVVLFLEGLDLAPVVYSNIVIGWQIASFVIALVVTLMLLKSEREQPRDPDRASTTMVVVWSILGFLMAMFGQMIANMIQIFVFGIEQQSENTAQIMEIARAFPIFIIIIAVIGPILEEIIFRKIIFGELYKRTNFFIAGTISGIVFALIHFDFTHLLVYFAMSFVFAFVYVQSKRIIVPIMAHVLMNTFVVVVQLSIDPEELENMLEQTAQTLSIIFGG